MINWTEKLVNIDELKPYERNPRTISKSAFQKLKASITDSGYHQRIIATPDLRVIGGHMRIKALQELGIKNLTVLVPDRELTQAEFRRILVQDNLAFGDFDFEILGADFELEELKEWGMSDSLLGMFPKAPFDDAKAEETPELETKAISKTGDLWLLGSHHVLCGDSTKPEDVGALLGDIKPNLMVTDPPYGVEYDANWRNEAHRANGKPIGGRALGTVTNDARIDWREAWALFPGNIAYVWHDGVHAGVVAESLVESGFGIRAQIIWAKNNFAIGRGDYHWQHEPCWYAVRNKGDWHGDRSQATLWKIDKPQKSETGHSTQKPVECMRRPMVNNSSEGQVVYDPFLGSGTSVIAAEQINRLCYGIEISPQYVDLIVRRWQTFANKEAILQSTGETFAAVETARG